MDTTAPGEGQGQLLTQGLKNLGRILGLHAGTGEAGKATALDSQATDYCYLNKLYTI